MKKDDLKTGMVLTMRNDDSFIVLLGCDGSVYEEDLLICLEDSAEFTAMPLHDYDETLVYVGEGFQWDLNSEYDIVEISMAEYVGDVFRALFGEGYMDMFDVIWEREDDGFDS